MSPYEHLDWGFENRNQCQQGKISPEIQVPIRPRGSLDRNSSRSIAWGRLSYLVVITKSWWTQLPVGLFFVLQKRLDGCSVLAYHQAQPLPMFDSKAHSFPSGASDLPSELPTDLVHSLPDWAHLTHITVWHQGRWSDILWMYLQDTVSLRCCTPSPVLRVDRSLFCFALRLWARDPGFGHHRWAFISPCFFPPALYWEPIFWQEILFLSVSNPIHKLPTGT